MRQEFLNIVNQLKNNQYYAISIVDDSTMNKVLTTTLGSSLVQKYGSVENYFEHLKNSGITSFSVQEYKKNGSGWKNTGSVIRNLTFQDKNTAVNSVPTPTPAPFSPLSSGLNGQQVVGLGFYEAANLMADSKESARLAEENKYLKEKNERLEKDIFDLKEEKLKREYDTAGKDSQNNMILGVIQALPQLGSIFGGGGSSSGLNAPVQTNQHNITQIKAEFIQYLSNPSISDALIEALYEVATKIATTEGFYEKLENLLNPQPTE
ncbi:hypothetical protein [Flavobacterium cucumis]|uniref:Uncharacterized protein n=1 Tax=Flavobacterium cucumis TaxID=416016 RepID=A0A1M7ZVH4_9FLAO|nr:hypothetical protein [Flavobacterium cucumis]SHO72881.1 hypothetical protein SAMN05443547_1225 [Flavobacterium cucumis]